MRILITAPWGERLGGAETMLHVLAAGAREHGHELTLVFFQPGPWPSELRAAGLSVEVLDTGRLRQPHLWPATVVRLADVIRRVRPDVVVNWSAKTHLYGAPAARLARAPASVIWWQHAIPAGAWIDRCATLLPAQAIGCSSKAAADAQQQLPPRRRTFVVSAGAPASTPERIPIPLRLPAGATVLGMVGRLQPLKGQDRLLHAHALLRERGHDIHTLIVGGDAYGLSSAYAASLPRLARELAVADSVTMTGQVPDAGPYIERMDILVNASDNESFGIVLIEAMARGVAVLTVDSGAPRDYLQHEKTAMLARSGQPADLADALEPLLASDALRRMLGQAGRELYLREFTEDAMCKRFFASLEAEVLSNSRSAA